MGRRPRETVDYFSHDCDLSSQVEMRILENKYGNDGYAVFNKMCEDLGRTSGFALECKDERKLQILAVNAHVDVDHYCEIMGYLASLDKIDQDLWANHRIIWCQEFVDRLEPLFSKRTTVIPQKPNPSPEQQLPELKSPDMGVSGAEMPQRKGKHSSEPERTAPHSEANLRNEHDSGGGLGEPLMSPDEEDDIDDDEEGW